MNKNSKIFIAGHNGMVGSAIYRLLIKEGYSCIIVRNRKELDLMDYSSVNAFFEAEKPDYVFLAAAKVGGIKANMENPGVFLYDNLCIQNNVIHLSHIHNVKKICFLGSSCIYPKQSPQPIKEEYILTGPLEPTNEGYALAKIAGLKLTEFYHKQYGMESVNPMPCNLYGPNDSFDLNHSHVLSALVKKIVDAKDLGGSVTVWGSGMARREFMHVDDVARASLFLMNNYSRPEHINVGWGFDVSIKELVDLISKLVGFNGEIIWDTSKPDGMLKKCLDTKRISDLGFVPEISLETGILQMINIYKELKTKL